MAWEHGNLKTDTNTYYNTTKTCHFRPDTRKLIKATRIKEIKKWIKVEKNQRYYVPVYLWFWEYG